MTYEPQWGSDVFGMYQSLVEGRDVPWSLLIKDFPQGEAPRLRLPWSTQLDWEKNVDHAASRITTTSSRSSGRRQRPRGYVDRWIVYGKFDGQQLFTAKELTVEPGGQVHRAGRRGLRLDHRAGRRPHRQAQLQTPAMIRFGQMTEDEVFVSAEAAKEGVVIENTGTEPLVSLRYFGPDAQPNAPNVGRSQETLKIGPTAYRVGLPPSKRDGPAVVFLSAHRGETSR